MSTAVSSLLSSSPVDWQAVLDASIAALQGSTGTLHRLDPADGMLKMVAYKGIPPHLIPVIGTIPVGKGIAGVAADRREPVELCNLQVDLGGVAKDGARATNVQGSLAVPCLQDDQVRGTLGVGLMVPHDFTEDEKSLLMTIGREVAGKL